MTTMKEIVDNPDNHLVDPLTINEASVFAVGKTRTITKRDGTTFQTLSLFVGDGSGSFGTYKDNDGNDQDSKAVWVEFPMPKFEVKKGMKITFKMKEQLHNGTYYHKGSYLKSIVVDYRSKYNDLLKAADKVLNFLFDHCSAKDQKQATEDFEKEFDLIWPTPDQEE